MMSATATRGRLLLADMRIGFAHVVFLSHYSLLLMPLVLVVTVVVLLHLEC